MLPTTHRFQNLILVSEKDLAMTTFGILSLDTKIVGNTELETHYIPKPLIFLHKKD